MQRSILISVVQACSQSKEYIRVAEFLAMQDMRYSRSMLHTEQNRKGLVQKSSISESLTGGQVD